MLAMECTDYRTPIESAPKMIWISDKSGRCCLCNQTWLNYTGRSLRDELGDGWIDGVHPDDRERSLATFLGSIGERRQFVMEYRLRRHDGQFRWIKHEAIPLHRDGRFIGYLGSCHDLAEGSLVADQERQARLDLAGQMAISVGHEIRNPMTTVRGYLQYYSGREEFRDYKEQFELMISELDHANAIITRLISLAKTKRCEKRLADINTLLEAIRPTIESDALRLGVIVEFSLRDVPMLLIDEDELRQLVLNLVHNGFDAMPPGGRLRIGTASKGPVTTLTVSDEGTGIPPDVLARIGTPFISTRENRAGLGLAICYRVASRHSATIGVQTGPSGTEFSICFPNP